MADEKPMQILFAMADVLALLIIALFTFLVAGNAFNWNDGSIVTAVALPVGVLMLIVTFVAYHNNNLLGTAIFGPLASFFLAYFILTIGVLPVAATANSIALLLAYIGVVILIDAIVAIYQPVRLLPVLLFIAAIGFFITAWNASSPSDGAKLGVGVFWMLYTLLSLYMAPAIMILVMRGKDMLPLMIKKATA